VLEIGSNVGRYRIEALIGEGDLASTYRVSADGVPYALRVLVVRDTGFSERLRRASLAQANVAHPNLLRVVDVLEANGSPGVVTEFVEGTDLESWIAQGQHRPLEVLTLFRQMVDGVRAAHAAGLIHRNLKPSKVLIGRAVDGGPRVQIADFLLGKVRQNEGGGAAVTQLGTTFGTPQYMSPEQFRGAASVDERADLFALGCLLYEMATGRRAFDGKNLLDVYGQVSSGKYRPVDEVRPGLPPWVGQLVDKLLAPEPGARIQTASILLEELSRLEATRPPEGETQSGSESRPARVSDALRAPPLDPTPRVPPKGKPRPPPLGEDDDLDDDPAPGPPTMLILAASLMLGLFVGLVLVLPVMLLFFWWLGAFG
jgi:serine/threonine protein kinase